jgi:uncharacterized protein involved in exopolysaccharide biosynthesis
MEEKQKIININIAEVIKLLYADRKKVCIYAFVAGVIGVALAFGTPKIYKSTVILAPEESGAGFSGSISSLASMVGMNMKIGQTGDALYPEIYPDLMNSTDFLVGLFPIKVTKDKTGDTFTYQDYIQNHQKLAVSDYPKALIVNLIEKFKEEENPGPGHKVDPFRLTKKEDEVAKSIKGKLDCAVDKKTNVITITVTDQDPLIAATVADSVQSHLQEAITDYRTKKARIDLEYMNELFAEARKQYDKARQVYASFADANQEILLQSYQSKVDDLENDMQLKFNIYQQVVEQRQLAQAKVQERTPAFTIVQRATVPIKHSSRPKIVTLAIWMFLGFMLRSGMLAWRNRKSFINL